MDNESMMMNETVSKHLDRTKASTRSDIVSQVMVIKTEQLSPTVKGFTLQVKNSELNFKSGQWVDLSIPDEDIVGGYSFTSPPHQLKEEGTVSLAIQSSDHPPTFYMTSKCKVGDKLSIRVGGDFVYDPLPDDLANLLLIGGGVGINPLFSMLQHHIYLLRSKTYSSCQNCCVQVLYSARSREELVFREHIDELAEKSSGLVQVQYFVTQESCSHPQVKARRMFKDDIQASLSLLDMSKLQCYICGPPPMTEDIVTILTSCEVNAHLLHHEKWW